MSSTWSGCTRSTWASPARPTCSPSRKTTSTAARPVTGSDDVPEALLGDVVLCPQVAERQALAAGHSPTQELHLLCTHGILHLLGYDHADPEEEQEMFAVQTRLMDAWQAAPHRLFVTRVIAWRAAGR